MSLVRIDTLKDLTFNEKLNIALKRRGMTLEDVAERLNVTRTYVYYVTVGERQSDHIMTYLEGIIEDAGFPL